MTPEQRQLFAIAIAGIGETLGQEVTSARISGLLMALDDVPWLHLEKALRIAHKTCRFVPSPGELRDLAEEAARVPGPYRALPEVERASVRESWKGKDQEAAELLAKLPKAKDWPDDSDKFKGYWERVAKRMHDMHAGTPTTIAQEGTPDAAGANPDPQGGQGTI